MFWFCIVLVAFVFNWLGFFAAYCMTKTVAGRYGAISGFGLSVVKWVLILKVRVYITFVMQSKFNMFTVVNDETCLFFRTLLVGIWWLSSHGFGGFSLPWVMMLSENWYKLKFHEQSLTTNVMGGICSGLMVSTLDFGLVPLGRVQMLSSHYVVHLRVTLYSHSTSPPPGTSKLPRQPDRMPVG